MFPGWLFSHLPLLYRRGRLVRYQEGQSDEILQVVRTEELISHQRAIFTHPPCSQTGFVLHVYTAAFSVEFKDYPKTKEF